MTRISVKIEGSVGEVIRVLRQIGTAEPHAIVGDTGRSTDIMTVSGGETSSAARLQMSNAADEPPPREWTESLARAFLSRLQPAARRMLLHVWRSGSTGIHRSTLCQHAELTPEELRSLLIGMRFVVRRFQQEHGVTLSRPVVANSRQQNYFVNPDFAAMVKSEMFDHGTPHQRPDGAGGF